MIFFFRLKLYIVERISATNGSTADTLDAMTRTEEKITEDLDGLKRTAKELERKWKQHKELDKLQEKQDHNELRHAWAVYHEREEEWEEQKAVG